MTVRIVEIREDGARFPWSLDDPVDLAVAERSWRGVELAGMTLLSAPTAARLDLLDERGSVLDSRRVECTRAHIEAHVARVDEVVADHTRREEERMSRLLEALIRCLS